MTILNSNSLIEGHLKLLAGLSSKNKKLLIQKLQLSDNAIVSENAYKTAFGAWIGDEPAEEIIATLRSARTENPIRELL